MDETVAPAGASEDEIAIALVVSRASEPIAGTIRLPQAPAVPFTGWMQLTQLLARALDPPAK